MDKLYFKMKNDAKQLKHNVFLALDNKQAKVLKKNNIYKNKYLRKRCFIIGNGPSLKHQDLSKTQNDMVFTVNMIPKSPMYTQLKSDFHVMADPFIFQIDMNKEEDREKLETFKKINNEKSSPVCFFPYAGKEIIEKLGLNQFLNIAYIHFAGEFYEGYKKKIDLTKCIPGFCNVVQYAIGIAIYMGFREIYLLGCDMTGYEQISVLAGKEIELHAYEMNENEKKAIQNTHSQINPEAFFRGFYNMFADYRRLYEYSEKRGIHIYNATQGGVLESLPRVDYNKLF